jgi:D-3-phosphoglycerate dehydrogenase
VYQIKTLNKISAIGLAELDPALFVVGDEVENEDGIIVRSAKMHDYPFPPALRAIARAGAGTNNIPIDRCNEAGIVVFNSPGANANAVKEEVIFAMLACSRKMMEGAAWAKAEAEAGGGQRRGERGRHHRPLCENARLCISRQFEGHCPCRCGNQ